MCQRLAERRAYIYKYARDTHYELKFSGVAEDVFARIRQRVDSLVGKTIPEAVQRLSAVYNNLRSDNPEDWSNAVHSCRRILVDLADAVYPPTNEAISVLIDGKSRNIKLGRENYINRIIAFISINSNSERFTSLIGSHLGFIGDRLDSVYEASNKGTHATIIDKAEADRYVVYTYMLVGDIISLFQNQ